jgi:hypothetical protein
MPTQRTHRSPRPATVAGFLALALVTLVAAAGSSRAQDGASSAAAGDTAAPTVSIAGSRCGARLKVNVSVRDRSALRRVRVTWRGRTVRHVRTAGARRTVRLGLTMTRGRLRRPGRLVVSAVDAAGNRSRGERDFIPCRSPGLVG